jgi:serine protease Do
MNRRRRFAFSTVAPILIVLAAGATFASEPGKKPPTLAEQITGEVGAIVQRSRGAICRVVAEGDGGSLAATGFFVDDAGTFITTHTIAGETEDIVVTLGDEQFPAARLGTDPRAGIAVLRVETGGRVPFLKLGKPALLPIASPVVALGYPIDLGLSPSFGIVAEHNIGFRGRYFATRHIRANLAVQRGEMGSPLLDLNGEVVGVILSVVEDRSGVFALPVAALSKALGDIQRHRRVRQGWFGTDVRAAEAPELGSTARITELRAGGPGDTAGLRAGDVLLQIGAWSIANAEDVLNATYYLTAGEPVTVRIARGGREEALTITPADPPNGEPPTAESNPPAAAAGAGDGAKGK